jgi:hypothetical protein
VFLLHNVHAKAPVVMQTRWAMNYLAGPLSRAQVPAINKLLAAKPAVIARGASNSGSAASKSPAGSDFQTRPSIPGDVEEYILPVAISQEDALSRAGKSGSGDVTIVYRPALLGQTQLRFLDRRYNLDMEVRRAALLDARALRGLVRWEEHSTPAFKPEQLENTPRQGARFSGLEGDLADPRAIAARKKSFTDWIYQTGEVKIKTNTLLKQYAPPETTNAAFRQQCSDAARELRDEEINKALSTFDRKAETLRDKIALEEGELAQDKADLSNRTLDEVGSGLGTLMGLLGGRKRSLSKNLSKRRMTARAKADVDESVKAIELIKKQLEEIELEKKSMADKINDRWAKVVDDVSEMKILPQKGNIFVELFGVAWCPFYLIRSGQEVMEIPAYKTE